MDSAKNRPRRHLVLRWRPYFAAANLRIAWSREDQLQDEPHRNAIRMLAEPQRSREQISLLALLSYILLDPELTSMSSFGPTAKLSSVVVHKAPHLHDPL